MSSTIRMKDSAVPATPSTGFTEFYVDGADSHVKTKDDTGAVLDLSFGGSAITALTGDVTASGPGSAAATVAQVGGSSAANVNTATALVNGAQSGNKVLASPAGGGSGAPAFRAVVAADIPTLNQNTTGTAANVTGVVAIANGGTGQTAANTALNALLPSQTSNAGKALVTDGTDTAWTAITTTGTANALAYFNALGNLSSPPNWTFDPDNYNITNIWSIGGADSRATYSQLRMQTNLGGTITGNASFLDLSFGGGGSVQQITGLNMNSGSDTIANHALINCFASGAIGGDQTGLFVGWSGNTAANAFGMRADLGGTISGDMTAVFVNQGATVLGNANIFNASMFQPFSGNYNGLSLYSNSAATVAGDYRAVNVANDATIGGFGAGCNIFQNGVVTKGWNGFGSYVNANVGDGSGVNAFGFQASFQGGHVCAGGMFGFDYNNTFSVTGTNQNIAFNANNSGAGYSFRGVNVYNNANQSESVQLLFASNQSNARTATGLDVLMQGTITDDVQGVRVNMNNTISSTQTPVGLSVQMGNASGSNPQGVVGIETDGRIQVNATTQMNSGVGFQIGNRIESLFNIPSGSPVTGTDSIGNNFAGDMTAQDNVANGGFGLGWVSGSMIASFGVAATKTVDTATVLLVAAALPDPGFTTGGSVTDLNLVRVFAPLPQGGTAVITNLYGLKVDPAFGAFGSAATNAWGLWVGDTTANNWLAKNLVIGGGTGLPTASDTLDVTGSMVVSGNIGFFGTASQSQQPSSGPQTAGAVYSATEQTMIQEMYDALRTYGLLT